MKSLCSLFFGLLMLNTIAAKSQCHYISSTSVSGDTVVFTTSGGMFASFGCAPIDPTYWLSGNGNFITATFNNPQDFPVFRVWGMNDDDVASVQVNGTAYSLSFQTAAIEPKVVCGLSPGPDGVTFAVGNLVGVNSNALGNYSYQDVQLSITNVSSITVTGLMGNGWGFAGVLVDCPPFSGISQDEMSSHSLSFFPNPVVDFADVSFGSHITNGKLCIYDGLGNQVAMITGISGTSVRIKRANLRRGVYFISVYSEDSFLLKGKMVLY